MKRLFAVAMSALCAAVPACGAESGHDPRQRQDPDGRCAVVGARSARGSRRPHHRARHVRRDAQAGRSAVARDRSAGPDRHPRSDRFTSSRDPRRPELHHRGELDRRAHARGGARPRQGRGADDEARIVADRRRRMEPAAVQGESPADASGARRGCARESGLHPARLRVGDADAARAQDARHHQRSRPAGGWTLRARCRLVR